MPLADAYETPEQEARRMAEREDKMQGTQDLAREIAFSIADMLQEPNTFSPSQDWTQLISDLREIEEAIMDMEE